MRGGGGVFEGKVVVEGRWMLKKYLEGASGRLWVPSGCILDPLRVPRGAFGVARGDLSGSFSASAGLLGPERRNRSDRKVDRIGKGVGNQRKSL